MDASQAELLHSPALSYAYPLYRNMLDNSIVFMYHGPITPDLIVDVLSLVEYRLGDTREERRISKKLFNIMVESFTLGENGSQKGYATLVVRQLPYLYTVSIGRRVRSDLVHEVKHFLDWVNTLSPDQLRESYHQLLQAKEPGREQLVGGVPAISILDLARKSHDILLYSFEFLNDEDSFFALEATIRKTQ